MDTRTADNADCALLSSGDCLPLARVLIVMIIHFPVWNYGDS